MIRFIHSADWQLGSRFRSFGQKATMLRAARMETLRRTMKLAADRCVDAFLIAGDLFEDNLVDDSLVEEAIAILAEHPSVPVFILPGNHDPFSGPEAVWNRRRFSDAPRNIRVLRDAEAVQLAGGAWLIASPLRQKVSTLDPSAPMADLAMKIPSPAIRIGITHGAPAIEGKHQANDFPIALNAATRAGLDYLAIGHWHNWLADLDGGRIVMPGTPEPDQFDQPRSGQVALVEIDSPGALPRISPLPVATLEWKSLNIELSPASETTQLDDMLSVLRDQASRTVLRIRVSGTVPARLAVDLKTWLESATSDFPVCCVLDSSRPELTPHELEHLRGRHPLLAQLLADIDVLERIATGSAPSTSLEAGSAAALTLADFQSILGPVRIDPANLDEETFRDARHLVFSTLRELME